jgi:lactoylglutathione lyase
MASTTAKPNNVNSKETTPATQKMPNHFTTIPSPPDHFPPGIPQLNGHQLDPGTKPSTDPTAGWMLNHLMIRIHDPVATLHFYVDIMGMRTIFSMNTGPYTVYYLGFPSSQPQGYDYHDREESTREFAADLSQRFRTTLGLLELVWVHGSEKLPLSPPGLGVDLGDAGGGSSTREYHLTTGNHAPHVGFGHLGFTAPDVPAAVERFRANGVTILKDVDVATKDSAAVTKWETDEVGIGQGDFAEGYKRILESIAFVQDPVSLITFSFLLFL